MRALFFSRDHRDLDIFRSGRFEKLMELDFAEAEPVIRAASALKKTIE
jgi:hypothetical protein